MNRRDFFSTVGAGLVSAHFAGAKAWAQAGGAGLPKPGPLELWYDKPAKQWSEALPLGNGRIGAMVFGATDHERIQLNESTLWLGRPHDYTNPGAYQHLVPLRDLIFKDKVLEAAELSTQIMGVPPILAAYQPFCDLNIDFLSYPGIDTYRRSLDIDEAVFKVIANAGASEFYDGTLTQREAFVSFPDQVFVLRLPGNRPGGQTVRLSLATSHPESKTELTPSGDLRLTGQLFPLKAPTGSWVLDWTGEGLKFAAQIRVIATGGEVRRQSDELFVDGADEIVILVSLATSFVNYHDISGDPVRQVDVHIEAAASRSFAELRRRHVADYQALFRRVDLRIDGPASASPTDKQIADFETAPDPAFFALLYQFGRYLLISASRPGGQPANLQGIWNEDPWPNWGSKWTTNINLEMNYWPVETGNLAECAEPFYDLLDDIRVTGAHTARVHYNCRGFVLHHNTDLWRAATPVDGYWGVWPVCGAWLVLQALEHYAFSLDETFLRDRLYPLMKDSAAFFLDFLVEIPAGKPFAGCLVTNPSMSPENFYIMPDGTKGCLTYGPTMDIEIISDLFDQFARVSKHLGLDEAMRAEVQAARKRLPPLQIGRNGELQEWIADYGKNEAEHRHISHLYALYPGALISPRETPDWARAAEKTLTARGVGTHEGSWPRALRAAMWARLGDGDKAAALLDSLVAHATAPSVWHDDWKQIDGHLGSPAAIAEMLLQSHTGEIVFLPALPTAWPSGAVKGLRARGGATISLDWKGGKLSTAILVADRAGRFKLRYGEVTRIVKASPGQPIKLDGALGLTGSGLA